MFYVYLMRAGESHYKVGVTKDLVKRVKSIQTSNPNRIELVTSRLVESPFGVESELHKKLLDLASGGGKEWFKLDPKQVVELCIFIQKYPHIELSERIIVRDLLDRQLMWKKTVEKKMDLILNNYQKAVVRTLNDAPKALIPKPESVPQPRPEDVERETFMLAKQVVLEAGKASTSLLQRRLRIGYGRAARIIEEMERQGIISAADGSRPRQVLLSASADKAKALLEI